MTEIHEKEILVVRQKLTDAKWYYQFKKEESDWLTTEDDRGPFETRAEAIKAAYERLKPKEGWTNDDTLGFLLAMAVIFLGLGSIFIWGFGITFLGVGIACSMLLGLGFYMEWQKKWK